MSVMTMARVWELSRNKGNDLLMLLAIADFADDEGNAYPSVPTLAKKCRMKPRNANNILAALRVSGELEVQQNEGPRGTNRYRIVLPADPLQEHAGVQKRAGMQERAPTPARTCLKPLHVSADEPSVNHQEPSERAQARIAPSLKSKSKKTGTTLKAFIEQCQAAGVKPIPEDDPIFAYAEKVGLDHEMLGVAWGEFKAYWLPTPKRKSDWPGTFRNAVRQNRAGLWYVKDGEAARWTTAGEQARRAAA